MAKFIFGSDNDIRESATTLSPFRWFTDRFEQSVQQTINVPFPIAAVTVGSLSQLNSYRLRAYGAQRGREQLYRVSGDSPLFVPIEGPVHVLSLPLDDNATPLYCRGELIFWPGVPTGFLPSARPPERFFATTAAVTTTETALKFADDILDRVSSATNSALVPGFGRKRARFENQCTVQLGSATSVVVQLIGSSLLYDKSDPDSVGDGFSGQRVSEVLATFTYAQAGANNTQSDVFFVEDEWDLYSVNVFSVDAAPTACTIKCGLTLWSE